MRQVQLRKDKERDMHMQSPPPKPSLATPLRLSSPPPVLLSGPPLPPPPSKPADPQ